MTTQSTVLVQGEARLRGRPDLATFSLSVRAAARRSAEVTETLAGRLARLRSVLEEFAPAIQESSTSGVVVAPTYEGAQSTRPRGYQGSVSSTVVVHDFDVLGDLLVALTGVDQCTVHGPDWSLRPDNPLYRQARLAAVADARSRADDYAAAFGTQVTGLVEVSDVEGGGRPVPLSMRYFGQSDDGQPTLELEPTEQEVLGRITVRFALGDTESSASPGRRAVRTGWLRPG